MAKKNKGKSPSKPSSDELKRQIAAWATWTTFDDEELKIARRIARQLELQGEPINQIKEALCFLRILDAKDRITDLGFVLGVKCGLRDLEVIEQAASEIFRAHGVDEDDIYLRSLPRRFQNDPPGLLCEAWGILQNLKAMQGSISVAMGTDRKRASFTVDGQPDVPRRQWCATKAQHHGLRLGVWVMQLENRLIKRDRENGQKLLKNWEALHQHNIATHGDPDEHRRIFLDAYDRLIADNPKRKKMSIHKEAAERAGIKSRQGHTYLRERKENEQAKRR